nr:hypothetical protein [Tanacetum cinerariifolium]
MVAILEKGEYNTDFHPMVDFIAASPLSPSFSWRIVSLFDTMLVHQGEGSGTPTEPHHTPSLEADPSYHTTSSIPLSSIPTALISPVTQTETTPIRQYTRRARIAQSSALPTVADELVSLVRDVSEGEACLTDYGFIADQDRATIAKSSSLPYDSAPRVTSPVAAEGSMQPNITELMALCTSLQSDDVPTASLFFATATVVTLYSRRKGKEVLVGSDTPKKQRFQEQIDAQVARELEEQQEREDKRMTAQIARYAEVEDFIPMGSKEEAERYKRKSI